MSRVFFVVFTLLTLGGGYATLTDVGVMEPGAKQIRAGSVGAATRGRGYSGVRRGK